MIMKIDKAKPIRDAEISTAPHEGIEEGKRKVEIKNIINTIKLGLSSYQIVQITGLSIAKIEKLKKDQE